MTSQPSHNIGLEGSCYHHQCKFNVILKLNLHFFENVGEKLRIRPRGGILGIQIFVIQVDSFQGQGRIGPVGYREFPGALSVQMLLWWLVRQTKNNSHFIVLYQN